jgi:hypothetical protein
MGRERGKRGQRTFLIPFPTALPKIFSNGTSSIPTTVTFALSARASATSMPMKEEPTTTTFFFSESDSGEPTTGRGRKRRRQRGKERRRSEESRQGRKEGKGEVSSRGGEKSEKGRRRTGVDRLRILHTSHRNDVPKFRTIERNTGRLSTSSEDEVLISERVPLRRLDRSAGKVKFRCLLTESEVDLEFVVEGLLTEGELGSVGDESLRDFGAVNGQMRFLRDDGDLSAIALLPQAFDSVSCAGSSADNEDIRVGPLCRVNLDGRSGRFAGCVDARRVGIDIDRAIVDLDLERLEGVETGSIFDVASRGSARK